MWYYTKHNHELLWFYVMQKLVHVVSISILSFYLWVWHISDPVFAKYKWYRLRYFGCFSFLSFCYFSMCCINRMCYWWKCKFNLMQIIYEYLQIVYLFSDKFQYLRSGSAVLIAISKVIIFFLRGMLVKHNFEWSYNKYI